jgi:hypothetical protein
LRLPLVLCTAITAGVIGGSVAPPPAAACTPNQAPTPTAIPRAGSPAVSPATSLVVLSGLQPSQLTLTAGATNVPLDGVTLIGDGIDGTTGRRTQFWRVRVADALLPTASELVLSGIGQNGARIALTTFTTAAAYDKKDAGTPAVLKSLGLRRVRYPLSEINAGQCVFAEYHGFIAVEIDPATIPGTPPESVVSTLTLAPRHGGAAPQSFTFTGPAPFVGFPLLTSGGWMPHLDPTLEYCASITSFGNNDLAVQPVTSNMLCATVEQVSGADASAPGTSDGCSVAGGASGGSATLLVQLVMIARRRRSAAARR